MPEDRSTAPARLFAKPAVRCERRADGTILLTNPAPLPEPAPTVRHWLDRWAATAPDRVFLAERHRAGEAWTTIGYAEAQGRVRRLAAGLLRTGLTPERPLALLSGNSIDHALMTLAAMQAGVPAAPISPAYSLMSQDHARLREIVRLLTPGMIWVDRADAFAQALTAIAGAHDAIVAASDPGGSGAMKLAELGRAPDAAALASFAATGPETVAKLLFTSGSTGAPKAVITTQRMLTANAEQRAFGWPFLAEAPPVIVDWLPWSHTFGGSHNFDLVLRDGGTLHIDHGRPAPGAMALTLANLREIASTIHFNVPRGYAMLVEALSADPELARRFFGPLRAMFSAGAALPQSTWDALRSLARGATGREVPLVSAWGTTETAPLATDANWAAEQSGNIGLPVPGVTLKLAPVGDRLEARVRGPNVTPGYWRRPAGDLFDEEGFYRSGDAVRLADPGRPEAGLVFDGRIAENFKLSSGSWVATGALRIAGIAALDPVAQDIVVAGHDRDCAGFLIFPNLAGCRRVAGLGEKAAAAEVLAHAALRAHIAAGLARLRDGAGGTTRYAARARLLAEPPSVDAGEITDKGYVNQRAVLARRAAEVEALYGPDPTAWIAAPD